MPKSSPVVYYVYDPMCSWCWGYRPTWIALQDAISKALPELQIRYRVGGLAPDNDSLMPLQMQHFLQQTWHRIAKQLGTPFNFDFWQQCKPRRSTYPACRACLLAREFNKEQEMLFAIQQAYYLQAKNPSDKATLIALAEQIGLNKKMFAIQLASTATEQKLNDEIAYAHSLPIQGFPSLVLSINGLHYALAIDYQHWESTVEAIKKRLQDSQY